MKRLHVSLTVNDFAASLRFYETLFGNAPTLCRDGYAKWRLDDPAVNFVIERRDGTARLDHLGIQTDDDGYAAIAGGLRDAGYAAREQRDARCCYARSDKAWSADPDGVAWELFHTHETIDVYGADSRPAAAGEDAAPCCATTTG